MVTTLQMSDNHCKYLKTGTDCPQTMVSDGNNNDRRIDQYVIDNDQTLSADRQRDSFSGRVCDDLCQLILQWLPIEDTIAFTGVCQQFRRCLPHIWSKQLRLTVDATPVNDRTNWRRLLKADRRYRPPDLMGSQVIYTVDIERFERVLQVFGNLRDICFGPHNIDNDNDVLNAITRYCHRLSFIRFDISDCPLKRVERFGKKFGHQLKSIEFIHPSDTFAVRPLIRLCPKLTTLLNVYFESLFVDQRLLVTNITKLRVHGIEDMALLDEFVTVCGSRLTHLDIRLYLKTSLSTNQVLRKLAQLTQLEVLFVYCGHYDTIGQCLAKSIAMIAESCKRLTTFAFEFETSDSFNTLKCFEGFRGFTTLRQLRFDITHFSDKTYPDDKLANDCLSQCRRLTHLELNSHQIDDQFFADINIKFPELRHLLIRTKDEITDEALRHISRCRHLRTLVISCFGEPDFKTLKSITDEGMIGLVTSCPQLRQIHCWNRMNITGRTIDALIEKSSAKPNTYFRFSCLGICDTIDLQSRIKSSDHLMANLVINDCPSINRLLYF